MKKEDIKILLVDDEPDIIEIISFNLSQEGYQILSASDGFEALKVAEKHLPHLIIMDVMMPNMDGIEACEQLRKDPRFVETIIMFLTARGEEYSYVAAFEAGADDYVTKPIKPKVLTSKVKGLLRRFKKNQKSENRLLFDGLVVDREAYKVILNDQEMSLPEKSLNCFICWLQNQIKYLGETKLWTKYGEEMLLWGIEL